MSKKKTIVVSSLGTVLLVIFVIGISYAYWLFRTNQTSINTIGTSCLEISLTDVTSAIKLEDAYPISDEDGMATTPYIFTITNTCDSFISYEVLLGVTEETTMNSAYMAAVLDYNEVQTLNQYPDFDQSLSGFKELKILQKGSLSQDDEVSYSLRLWMDESVTSLDSMNKVFEAKIIVSAQLSTYSPVEQGFNKLADAMLVNEYQSTTLDHAIGKIENKQDPDFTQTAPIIIWDEYHANTTAVVSSIMPHPDLFGGENLEILPVIGTGYTFDSDSGTYSLTNAFPLNPTTLDYSGSTSYYYCRSGFSTDINDKISVNQIWTHCPSIYKIVSARIQDGTLIGNGGGEIKTRSYQMTSYRYNTQARESDNSDRGLYTMTDHDGISYYYRGNVTNNYVYFAGYYWRIIRRNGDGSVRLLYAGTSPDASGTMMQIDYVSFHGNKTNPGYVGYMYGNTLNESYEKTYTNDNDSTIKAELDNWYKINIVDKNLEHYIADSGFCNDRSLYNGDGFSSSGDTYFGGYQRYMEHAPTLICPRQNDLFTVDNSDGNQDLIYPIGLITVDELLLSGMFEEIYNKLAYTYSSASYWTMSPSRFVSTNATAQEFLLHSDGFANYYWAIDIRQGIRPVINLAADVEITGGIGTKNSPFVVK